MDGMTTFEPQHGASAQSDRAQFALQKGRQERELCRPRRAERDGLASGSSSRRAWILRFGPSEPSTALADRAQR